ncbi:lipid-A-disaccharide synthase N-terminal domain-containing protein [Cognataquiflexum rubidum]|uniref:lipid-A-disaccharide synthase N-terminal domain-containing protein n=1 Tax=Cognataquiflexum rubidum TaxID=2922273 RepID=UPI001F14589D|nr:lipid-A-disaccharide synthase N-terminal domain-containing protein [Cognataquiflexum rubidum]MCH6236017.1 lipid-A-disaccharide synthase N-terminal domain-containing protein [Cognataquiflexum rubidum]
MILILGFLSQGLFGFRLLIQLWHTENKKSNEAPILYWYVSIWAALLFLLYGILRQDIVIIIGQLITYYIYIRNVHLHGKWSKIPLGWKAFFFAIPVFLLTYFYFATEKIVVGTLNDPIIIIGFVGQLFMNLRFVLQWIYAERIQNSVFPLNFWYMSIFGSLLLLVYGFWHPQYGVDPVIILAQTMGLVVYARGVYRQLKTEPKQA